MVELITRYFVQHNQVALPGLGVLSAVPVGARYDVARQVMVPPRVQFQWQPLSGESDSMQLLAGFISRQSQLSEEESFEAIKGFCAMVKTALKDEGEFRWSGLGKLVQIAAGTTGFVPDATLDDYFQPLEAIRAAKPLQSHQMLVGDKETNTADMQQLLLEQEEPDTEGKWWVAALVIGLAVTALIVGRLGGWI